LEALYKKLHSDIRKNPKKVKAEKRANAVKKVISKPNDKAVVRENSQKKKWIRHLKLSRKERKQRVDQKIKIAIAKSAKKTK